MKKNVFLMLVMTFLILNQLMASDELYSKSNFYKTSIGIGLGMDYGGIGGSLLFYPQTNIGLFGGVGYAFAGLGYNVGVKIRLITENHTSKLFPYLT